MEIRKYHVDRMWESLEHTGKIIEKIDNRDDFTEYIKEIKSDIKEYFKNKAPIEEYLYVTALFKTVYHFNKDLIFKIDYSNWDNDILESEILKLNQKMHLEKLAGNEHMPKTEAFIQYLKSFIKSEKTKSIDKSFSGFQTKLTEFQIEKLYSHLQPNFIDCSLIDFKAMFTDNPKPIKWIKSNALLAFLVYDLFQKYNPDNYWNKAESIFIDKSNNPITSLRQSHQTAYNNKNKEPKGYNELKNIYSPLL